MVSKINIPFYPLIMPPVPPRSALLRRRTLRRYLVWWRTRNWFMVGENGRAKKT
jgi:hypothetical protein